MTLGSLVAAFWCLARRDIRGHSRWMRSLYVLACVGAGNDYGHPHREVLALLEEKGIPLLRTDTDGTVSVVSDGRTVTVLKS